MTSPMKHLRLIIMVLAGWFIAIVGVDLLFHTAMISIAAYSFVVGLTFVYLAVPKIARFPIWVVLLVPTMIFILLKAGTGGFSSAEVIPYSITEILVVILTIVIAYQISYLLNNYEESLAKAKHTSENYYSETDSSGLGFIYREVRRARNHQRPFALMTVAIDQKSMGETNGKNRRQESPKAVARQWLASIAAVLCNGLEDCSIIVRSDDHFIIGLPETTPEDIPTISERIRRQVYEQVGVYLVLGSATLPNDGYTFEGLLNKATEEMKACVDANFLKDAEKSSYYIKHISVSK